MPRRDAADALLVLNTMLEFFDGGRHWTRGHMRASDGNRCLVGALQHVRAELRIQKDGTAELLHSLVTDHQRRAVFCRQSMPRSLRILHRLMYFNDRCQSYQDVRELIVRARERAQAELWPAQVSSRTEATAASQPGDRSADMFNSPIQQPARSS
jgi:hypothetical protein